MRAGCGKSVEGASEDLPKAAGTPGTVLEHYDRLILGLRWIGTDWMDCSSSHAATTMRTVHDCFDPFLVSSYNLLSSSLTRSPFTG